MVLGFSHSGSTVGAGVGAYVPNSSIHDAFAGSEANTTWRTGPLAALPAGERYITPLELSDSIRMTMDEGMPLMKCFVMSLR